MPALLRQMDFLRWLRRKETHRVAELTRTVRAEIAVNPWCGSLFIRALFQLGKRAASEAAKCGCGGVELLGVVGAARLECVKPAAETGELIRRQLGNGFGDLFDFHAAPIRSARRRSALGPLGTAALVARNEVIESPQSSQSICERFRSGIDYLTPPDL